MTYRPHPGDPYTVYDAVDSYSGNLLDVAANLERADGWWLSSAEAGLAELVRRGQPFTAADLTDLGVPDPDISARWGSLFADAKARGLVIAVGYQPSRRSTRNGGVCRVWQGTASAA